MVTKSPSKILLKPTHSSVSKLSEMGLWETFIQSIGHIKHIYLSRLEQSAHDNGDSLLSIRIPDDYDLGGLQFKIADKTNCALIIGVSKWSGPIQRWELEVTCLLSISDENHGPIPYLLVDQVSSVNSRQVQEAEIQARLKKWSTYLEIEEQSLLKKQFQLPYDSFSLSEDEGGAIFLNLPTDIDQQKFQKLKKCRKDDEINILDINNKQKIATTFEAFKNTSRTVKLLLQDEALAGIYNGRIQIPSQGLIENSLVGESYQLNVQQEAVKRLQRYPTLLPNLDRILYGTIDNLTLKKINTVQPIPLEECLNQGKINERQRLAIAMALASPDCFFLQGPPGTGKTTFISELCYQLASRGKKVLISSQSNLAVDNAMSRLQNHAEILAIRLGKSDVISEEAQPFVGENAVRRWLKSLAQSSEKQLGQLETQNSYFTLFIEHWDLVKLWASEGKAWSDKKQALLIQREQRKEEENEQRSTVKIYEVKLSYLSTLSLNLQELLGNFNNNRNIDGQSLIIWNQLDQQEFSVIEEYWQMLIASAGLSTIAKDPWNIALYLQEYILMIAPDGKIYNLQQDGKVLQEQIQPSILELQAISKEIQYYENLAQINKENLRVFIQSEQIIGDILDNGAPERYQEQSSLSVTYNNILQIIQAVKLLNIKSLNLTNQEQIIEYKTFNKQIFLFGQGLKYFFNRHQNLVNKIIDWEKSILYQTNDQELLTGQSISLIKDLINAKNIASIPLFGKLFTLSSHKYKKQLRKSTDKIINEIDNLYRQNSLLAQQIYKEYETILENTRFEKQEYENLYQVQLSQYNRAQNRWKALNENLQTLSIRVSSFEKTFHLIFSKEESHQLLESITSDINRADIHLQNINDRLKSYIQNIEKNYIPKYRSSLLSVLEEVAKLLTKYNNLKNQSLKRLQYLEYEYQTLYSQIQQNEAQLETAQKVWLSLREQKSIPTQVDQTFPDLQILENQKKIWLNEIGGYEKASSLITQISLVKEWITRLNTDDSQISEELYEIFFRFANVIGSTCIHAGHKKEFLKYFQEFDVVIVDEVSKATPTELLVPCLLGKKIVLVGDHKQLPPIFGVESCFIEAANALNLEADSLKEDLSNCLFKDRYEYLDSIGSSRTLMLNQQYRMHSQIMAAINQFYDGSLQIGDLQQDQDRNHGLEVGNWLSKNNHLVWLDLPINEASWSHTQAGSGRENIKEAKLIVSILEQIFLAIKDQQVIDPIEIGIISVYKAQANRIKKILREQKLKLPKQISCTVGTVDKFQGIEKDIVFVSLVLNSPNVVPSEFLRTPERINVAMSRARKLLFITGSSHNYVEIDSPASPMYAEILNIAKLNGGYFKANELLD